MSGRIIYRRPRPHECVFPVATSPDLHTGDVWQCDDCARTWCYKDSWNWPGHWTVETNKQRRARGALT
jgi:hypothetical protein